jgi:hypothetical protein
MIPLQSHFEWSAVHTTAMQSHVHSQQSIHWQDAAAIQKHTGEEGMIYELPVLRNFLLVSDVEGPLSWCVPK